LGIKLLNDQYCDEIKSGKHFTKNFFSEKECQHDNLSLLAMDNCSLLNQISISTIKQKTQVSAEGWSDFNLGIATESEMDENSQNELNRAQISDEQYSDHFESLPLGSQPSNDFNEDEKNNSMKNESLRNMMSILNEINQSIKVKKDIIRDLEHSEKYFDNLQDNLEIIQTEIRGLAYTHHIAKSSSCDKQVLTNGISTNRNKLREIFKPLKRVKSESKQLQNPENNIINN